MASIPKLLSRPRLQLLVLMLVLGAGLLPKNSMAQDVVKPVQCYEQKCDSEQPGQSTEDCLKPPATAAKKVTCDSGYCFQSVAGKSNAETNKQEALIDRRCLTAEEILMVTCLKNEPGNCLLFDKTTTEQQVEQKQEEFAQCLFIEALKKATEEAKKMQKSKGRSNAGRPESTAAICVCNTDLCNDRTLPPPPPPSATSGSSGVERLSYNSALFVTLLVSVLFPLRTMFLVG